MSHFFTLVIVPPDENVEETVETLLAPYNENRRVRPYLKDCYCAGRIAKNEAEKQAADELGTWDSFRERFGKEHPLPEGKYDFDLSEDEQEKRETQWKEFTRPLRELEAKLEKEHPLYQKPDPTCEECGGSGKNKTTYNPDSKWDWYEIGGRWNGELGGKNQQPVSEIKDYPFAIVTPDGDWFEKGDMGWWGMVKDEKSKTEWRPMVDELLAKYHDHIGVVVDCHI